MCCYLCYCKEFNKVPQELLMRKLMNVVFDFKFDFSTNESSSQVSVEKATEHWVRSKKNLDL